jgi:hypothetical protein
MNLTQSEGGARICSGGSCKQGKSKCETPYVCHVPDDDEASLIGDLLAAGFACLMACICIAAVVHWLMN